MLIPRTLRRISSFNPVARNRQTSFRKVAAEVDCLRSGLRPPFVSPPRRSLTLIDAVSLLDCRAADPPRGRLVAQLQA